MNFILIEKENKYLRKNIGKFEEFFPMAKLLCFWIAMTDREATLQLALTFSLARLQSM